MKALPVLMHLLKAYPEFTKVEELPLETMEEKVILNSFQLDSIDSNSLWLNNYLISDNCCVLFV
jgi:hypothetical protein